MTRYKGRAKPTVIERNFPNHVEVLVPLDGFGQRLDAMHDWHLARGIEARRGRSRREEDGRNYIRWCFSDSDRATEFAIEFGGTINQANRN
jgi:hypothetical protein